jgi:AcrR family transcriptional regulator
MWEKGISRKERQACKTRRRILPVAAKLFARHGYHKTTVNDIARGVRMTTGTVFHHFPSKEALLDTSVFRLFQEKEDLAWKSGKSACWELESWVPESPRRWPKRDIL